MPALEQEFQSTRPRGARPVLLGFIGGNKCFNPRARAGRDVKTARTWPISDVSIHAPARGATKANAGIRRPKKFQSTRPRGARRVVTANTENQLKFQSTRPRGARRFLTGRTRPGARVSIHAPARGATQAGDRGKSMNDVFQSTRPRGARLQTYTIL